MKRKRKKGENKTNLRKLKYKCLGDDTMYTLTTCLRKQLLLTSLQF